MKLKINRKTTIQKTCNEQTFMTIPKSIVEILELKKGEYVNIYCDSDEKFIVERVRCNKQ